ncbi:MAG TPA: hypothetical protein VKS81_03145, partial [Bacteroidota bacterium]|nr:hypothetical protein [Bacteroidota bacterium]
KSFPTDLAHPSSKKFDWLLGFPPKSTATETEGTTESEGKTKGKKPGDQGKTTSPTSTTDGFGQTNENALRFGERLSIQNHVVLDHNMDSIKQLARDSILNDLRDTTYSGPSIRRSDIIIDDSLQTARILYRNYKEALRYHVALDPAERMGIFRVRYVPFPIVGRKDSTFRLLTFASEEPVFEVGLNFGDYTIAGDEYVLPEFSLSRLGVAMAITPKLFGQDADIIGLAFTYEFNSYASIGLGGNFAQNEIHSYMSFGINKKAFDNLIKGLAKIFQ